MKDASSWRKMALAGWAAAIVVSSLGGGLALGLALQKPPIAAAPSGAASRQSSLPDVEPAPLDLSVAQLLEMGDRALIEDHGAHALKLYRQAAPPQREATPQLLYRQAAAYELLGQLEQARDAYHALAGRAGGDGGLELAAQLGVARAQLGLGQHAAAAALLYELTLDPRIAPEGLVAAETAYMLSRALTSRLLETPTELLLDDNIVAPPRHSRTGRSLLDLAAAPAATPAATRDGVHMLFKISARPEEIQYRVSTAASVSPLSLIEELLELAGLRPAWTESARAALLDRSLMARADNMSLATLLDAILTPLGIVWEPLPEDGVIGFRAYAELNESQRMEELYRTGLRSSRRALAVFADHPQAPQTMLAVGNLLFLQRQPEEAAGQYDQLLRRFGQSDTAAVAWFNLAKAQLSLGRIANSLDSFYHVVDGIRGGELRAIAALYVGRIHLEQEQLPQAKRVLTRVLAMTTLPRARSAAALLLATAHLREGNPHAANLVLLEHRADLAQYGQDAASLLGAVARLETSIDDRDRARHGRALVSALSHMSPNAIFGRYGAVVMGDAYRSLGFLEEMAGAYEMALSTGIGGPAAERITLELARVRRSQGQFDDARTLYRQLVDAAPAAVMAARVDEAELEFEQQRDPQCLAVCRELLGMELPETERAKVLHLMGRAYRRQADHYRAALCFSGLVPEEQGTTP